MSGRCKEAVELGQKSPCPPWPHVHHAYAVTLSPEELAAAEQEVEPDRDAFSAFAQTLPEGK